MITKHYGLFGSVSQYGNTNNSANAFRAAVGKRITALSVEKIRQRFDHYDALVFTLDDGSRLALFDGGQSCCESRYMSTDDDLSAFVGATLLDAEVRGGPETGDEKHGDVHETAFLVVTTSLGAFTCVTHNEHNGYYGGFRLSAQALEAA